MYKNLIYSSKRHFTNILTTAQPMGRIYPDRFINYFLKPSYYTYVDNSAFIEKVFENNFTEIILCPNNHGKTFGLETLKYFLSCIPLIEEKVDKNMRMEFFKSTNIYSNQNFFNEHFSKYPVIFFNFRELDQNYYKDNVEKFKFEVKNQFEQMLQFLQNPENKERLTNIDLRNIDEFFNNYKNFSENQLLNSYKDLAKILLKITKQNPFLILDDYDYPLMNSHKKGFYDEMLLFMENFMNIIIKGNNFMNKTIISGVNLMEQSRLFSQISNTLIHLYDQESKYSRNFFDFTELKYENGNIPTTEMINIAGQLNLRNLIENLINEANTNYLSGIKLIADLKYKSESEINKNEKVLNEITVNPISIDFSNIQNRSNAEMLYVYLYYNGLINSKGIIRNTRAAWIINNSLSQLLMNPHDLNYSFDRKLSFAYYYYFLCREDMDKFLEYFKHLFDFVSKTMKIKNPNHMNLLPEFNMVFRTEKDFENYLIDKFTIDLTNENKDYIRIFSVDDDEMYKVSEELKKFTIIIYDKLNIAIFLRGIKFKKPAKELTYQRNIENNQVFIEEMLHNPNFQQPHFNFPSASNSFTKTSPLPDIAVALRTSNEQVLNSINKQEAINFLLKISQDINKVYFISVSNYQKQIDYILEITNLERE